MLKTKNEKRRLIRKGICTLRKIQTCEDTLDYSNPKEALWGARIGIEYQHRLLERIARCLLELDKPLFALTFAYHQQSICLVSSYDDTQRASYQYALKAAQAIETLEYSLSGINHPASLIVVWDNPLYQKRIRLLLSIAEYWILKNSSHSGEILLYILSSFQFENQIKKVVNPVVYANNFLEIQEKFIFILESINPIHAIKYRIRPLWKEIVDNFALLSR